MAYSILVVDDEALTLRTIGRALQAEGYEVTVAMSGEEAVKAFAQEPTDLALLDVVLPGIDGIEVLRQIKKQNTGTVVLMMSAYHMVEHAVESMKLGAYDYLIKPFHITDLLNTIQRASEVLALRVRVRDTVQTQKTRFDFGRVVTKNEQMREMLEMARKASESDKTTILIQGESGTGKEVLAKAIHYHSPRAQDPLVELNCAALPDTLLESELSATNRAHLRTHGAERRIAGEGAWRNAVPRRDREHVIQRPGEAVARAGRRNLHAPRRYEVDHSGCENHRGDEQGSERCGGQRRIPGRPVLSAERHAVVHSPAAGSSGRHSAFGVGHHAALQPRSEKELRWIYSGGSGIVKTIPLAG